MLTPSTRRSTCRRRASVLRGSAGHLGLFSRDGRSYDGCLRVRDWSAPDGPFFDTGVIDVLYPGESVQFPELTLAAYRGSARPKKCFRRNLGNREG